MTMTDQSLTLIVDDEPDIRELLELTLGRMNVDTKAVANITDAKELLKDHPFNMCLTDMKLPDGNGMTWLNICNPNIQIHLSQ